MPLTVLTDSDVREILLRLKKDDILSLQHNLAEALHEYSTGNQDSGCCSANQPLRTVLKKNGITTLFMPASSGSLTGVKIVALSESGESQRKSSIAGSTASINSPTTEAPSLQTTGSTSSTASQLESLALTEASGSDQSSAPSISGSAFKAPSSIESGQSTTPRGSITLMDSFGYPKAIVNAEEVTAFRTALAATMLMQKRHNVHTITVFGAGKQAYWHIRLALLLREDEIHHVHIVNRNFERATHMLKEFLQLEDAGIKSKAKFTILTTDFREYGRVLKDNVRKADVIFCCTPSTEPLFPAEFLTSHEGRRKGRYVSAIGSYKPHMLELHPEILKQAVAPGHGHHHHKHATEGGVVVVDSLEACLKEAGEVIQAKLGPRDLVEVGELIMVKKAALKEIELGGHGEKGLVNWLTQGNVIYKSVGLGLMDLVVGGDIVDMANEMGIGTRIGDF